jgi:hypothetical protein
MLESENAETRGWPSLSFLTTGGLTISGSSTSSSFAGSGVIGVEAFSAGCTGDACGALATGCEGIAGCESLK